MRIVKLSKEVFGFDTVEACIAFFEHVIPWQKGRFYIVGEGSHIAADGLDNNELVLFSYSGQIVCLALANRLMIDNDGYAYGIEIFDESKKVFHNTPKLKDLESLLHSLGYSAKVVKAQGWNIIESQYEQAVVNFLMKHDWNNFLK